MACKLDDRVTRPPTPIENDKPEPSASKLDDAAHVSHETSPIETDYVHESPQADIAESILVANSLPTGATSSVAASERPKRKSSLSSNQNTSATVNDRQKRRKSNVVSQSDTASSKGGH